MSITAIAHVQGTQIPVEIEDIAKSDEDWFKANNVKLSVEHLNGNFIVYGDVGLVSEGEPDEAIEISFGRTCRDTLAALRDQCDKMLAK